MSLFAQIFIALVALLHIGFLVLEMFLWDKSAGRKIFGLSTQMAAQTRVLAANQGLYNGFLAAGLIWSLFPVGAPGFGPAIAGFFLGCIIVAGIYGAATVSRMIFFVQAAPALIAIALVAFT
jgi:putative membrane protein